MAAKLRLTNAETKLAELIWDGGPIASMELVKQARGNYGWSKSTTFTHLKALVEKGLAKNENSSVTMLYTRDEITAEQSCQYIDSAFGGSMPLFIASFARSRKLTPEQVSELRRLIDEYEGGGGNG